VADSVDLVASIAPIDPDPQPWTRRTVLHQQWEELASFHWPYDPDVVQALLPQGLTVDTFDDSAWVGLIPFEMRRVRIGATPPVPWLGSFVEINVRTYVVLRDGRRAVWFFSLDVPRLAIVGVARSVFALPYKWATTHHQVDGATHRYRMVRQPTSARAPFADITFTVGPVIAPDDVSPFEHFVTARWALTTNRRTLLHGAVHHPRWPLRRVENVSIHQSLIEAAGLPNPCGEPLSVYSDGVGVQVGWLEPADAAEGSTRR
jgi:uncharacterized protein